MDYAAFVFALTSSLAGCLGGLKTEEQHVSTTVPPPPHPPSIFQNNKAGDDDYKKYLGMAGPTHLLVHHTVCTVILNRDQRETTGD